MNAGELVTALGGKWRGGTAMCLCPAHTDRGPSLAVTEKDGRLLFKCHAGCEQGAVIDALRGRGLWHERPEPKRPPAKTRVEDWVPIIPVPSDAPPPDFGVLLGQTPAGTWDYLDRDGRLLGYVGRVDREDGKAILPLSYCRGPDGARAWRVKALPPPRPLYGLASLAAQPAAPVLVVEGEKTACAARELFEDYAVLSWQGGASSVAKADWAPLKGRRVTIWPDADDEGRKAADNVARFALAVGASEARIVRLPSGLPKGWDLADPPPDGVDLDFHRLVAAASDARSAELARLGVVTADELTARAFQEPRWAVPDTLPEGAAFLAGKPKTGKSWLALDIAVAKASGGSTLGRIKCEPGEVLFIGLEDTERRLQGRLRAVLQGAPAPRNLSVVTKWRASDQGGIDDLRLWLRAHPATALIVVDTFAKIRGKASASEGIYQNDYAAISPFKSLADEFGIALLLVHHVRKEKADDPLEMISGTGGLTGAVDTVLVLKREPGSPFGTLYVRGRDVVEHELALQFESETGKWLALGPAEDWRKSEERKELVRALSDATEPMSPAEIATELGKTRKAVQRLLAKMAKTGEIVALGNGEYMVPRP